MIRVALTFCIAVLLSFSAFAQHASNAKSFKLTGKVTEVGPDRLKVAHGNIEGYMAAMTMDYKVDKKDVLGKVKAGDEIEATVYAADYTLYDVKVVPPSTKSKK